MKYKIIWDKYDKDFAVVEFEKDDNKVSFLVRKEVKDWLEIVSFISGRIGNTRYRKHRDVPTLYEKDGRGRESEESKRIIRELYSQARNMIDNGEVK